VLGSGTNLVSFIRTRKYQLDDESMMIDESDWSWAINLIESRGSET
jgi:hypothetical protein